MSVCRREGERQKLETRETESDAAVKIEWIEIQICTRGENPIKIFSWSRETTSQWEDVRCVLYAPVSVMTFWLGAVDDSPNDS